MLAVERRQTPVGTEEGFLDQVLSIICVPGDRTGHPEEYIDFREHESIEADT